MNSRKFTHIFTLGFALFAMFFGAGNLLLPPYIGLNASDSWLWTTLGFTITAIIIPFLGVISVVLSGESFTDLANRVNKHVGTVLGVIIMLGIGPLIAIPRTAATTYEVGVLPIFPEVNAIVVSVLFFILTAYIALSSSKVVDLIGNYLTPILIVILCSLLLIGIFNPSNTLLSSRFGRADAFILGFEEGYQTLDVLASVIFAGIIIAAARLKGYNTVRDKSEIVIKAGLLAAICLFLIYGGLIYLGAHSSHEWSDSVKRAPLLLHISNNHLGGYGTIAMSISIALACLTTAVALTTAVGSFFSQLFNHKISYKVIVYLCSIFSCALSITGVDKIIEYAYPFLAFVYPIVITLVLYIVVFGRLVKYRSPFIGAVLATALIAFIELLESFGLKLQPIDDLISKVPLAEFDLAWILPSFILFVFLFFIARVNRKITGG